MPGDPADVLHYLLVALGLVGVAVLLFPQARAAARGSRRTALHPPANPTDHEPQVALGASVGSGRLTALDVSAVRAHTGTLRDGSLWRALAVVSSVAAAGVHAAVLPHHLEESVVVGAFFLVVTLAQATWACLVTIDATDRRLLVAGIAGSLGLIAMWAVSRTTGLPLGPGREAVGGWDVAAGVWELVVVAACVVGLRRPHSERALVMGDLGRLAWTWMLASALVLLALALTVAHG